MTWLDRGRRVPPFSGRAVWAVVFLLVAVAGSAVVLYRSASRHEPHSTSAEVGSRYFCPMHPSYESDEPGNCPICSMKLVPRGKGGAGSTQVSSGADGMPSAPSIQISPERQQQIGVRFAEVERTLATAEVRAVGKVAFDESQITHVHTKVNGWIEEVFVDFVGAPVKQGQALFTIYSPDLVASQEEYLLALRAQRELGSSSFDRIAEGSRALVESARQRLRRWDMTPAQIEALERRGEVSRTVAVFSPTSGIVTERAAYHHGRYVTPELDLYTIARLDPVWVVANVYEYELPNVVVGQEAEATLPYDATHPPLHGKVSYVQPFLDPATRTVQVRFEFPNEDQALRPETFVNVLLRKELGPALVVPKEAVMDTGVEEYVFVDRGNGYLEPRVVRTGTTVGAGQVVLEGLREGDRVVTAANFVVDSESRLQGAFDAMTRAARGESVERTAASSIRAEIETQPSPAKAGSNELRVRVADSAGTPVVGAQVDVKLFMPAMGSMAPMQATAPLREEIAGTYRGRVDVPMAGTWQVTVEATRDGASLGTARATITAR